MHHALLKKGPLNLTEFMFINYVYSNCENLRRHPYVECSRGGKKTQKICKDLA
jgi:hypothetical protein